MGVTPFQGSPLPSEPSQGPASMRKNSSMLTPPKPATCNVRMDGNQVRQGCHPGRGEMTTAFCSEYATILELYVCNLIERGESHTRRLSFATAGAERLLFRLTERSGWRPHKRCAIFLASFLLNVPQLQYSHLCAEDSVCRPCGRSRSKNRCRPCASAPRRMSTTTWRSPFFSNASRAIRAQY